MIRKVKPKAIICYGEPFKEMQGKIIHIDYAKTNNLNSKSVSDVIYIKKTTGYVLPFIEKGMGRAGGKKISLPKNDAQLKHIFGKRKGHVPDTTGNREMLEDLANDTSKFSGNDKYGNSWHIDTNGNGKSMVGTFQK